MEYEKKSEKNAFHICKVTDKIFRINKLALNLQYGSGLNTPLIT